MLKDTTVIRLRQPDAIDDPLSELAGEGALADLALGLMLATSRRICVADRFAERHFAAYHARARARG